MTFAQALHDLLSRLTIGRTGCKTLRSETTKAWYKDRRDAEKAARVVNLLFHNELHQEAYRCTVCVKHRGVEVWHLRTVQQPASQLIVALAP